VLTLAQVRAIAEHLAGETPALVSVSYAKRAVST